MIAPFYAVMYHQLLREAMRFGWNLCIHGSMTRDLDMVLIPWREDAEHEDKVIDAFREFVMGKAPESFRAKATKKRGYTPRTGLSHFSVEQKPHGRRAITIRVGYYGYELDISIMPRIVKESP